MSMRPELGLLRSLEARFPSFRGLATADTVDLASRRAFSTGSEGTFIVDKTCLGLELLC